MAKSRVGWRITHLEVCVQSSGKGRASVNRQVPKCQVKDRDFIWPGKTLKGFQWEAETSLSRLWWDR